MMNLNMLKILRHGHGLPVMALISVLFAAVCQQVGAVSANAKKDRLDIPSVVSPRAAMSNLIGIARAGKSYVAVGDDGHILLSSDQGRTWMQSKVPLSSPIVAVHFPVPALGWAVGHDGVIVHSTDGGKSWQRQLDGRQAGAIMTAYYQNHADRANPSIAKALSEAKRFQEEGPSKPFLDVYFENEKSGWVIGSYNLILKTDDGGKTWTPWLDRIENENGYSLHALRLIDGELFMVGELGLIQRLDRVQHRFVAVKGPYQGSLFGLMGAHRYLYVYGLGGNLFRSQDKGASWQSLKQPNGAAFVGGTVLADGRLVLVTNSGGVLMGNANGDIFTPVVLPLKMGILSAAIATDDDALLLVGDRGVMRYRH